MKLIDELLMQIFPPSVATLEKFFSPCIDKIMESAETEVETNGLVYIAEVLDVKTNPCISLEEAHKELRKLLMDKFIKLHQGEKP